MKLTVQQTIEKYIINYTCLNNPREKVCLSCKDVIYLTKGSVDLEMNEWNQKTDSQRGTNAEIDFISIFPMFQLLGFVSDIYMYMCVYGPNKKLSSAKLMSSQVV